MATFLCWYLPFQKQAMKDESSKQYLANTNPEINSTHINLLKHKIEIRVIKLHCVLGAIKLVYFFTIVNVLQEAMMWTLFIASKLFSTCGSFKTFRKKI